MLQPKVSRCFVRNPLSLFNQAYTTRMKPSIQITVCFFGEALLQVLQNPKLISYPLTQINLKQGYTCGNSTYVVFTQRYLISIYTAWKTLNKRFIFKLPVVHKCVRRRETSAIYDVFTTCRFITPILLKILCLSRNIFMRSFKIFSFSFHFYCGAFITQALSISTLAATQTTLKLGWDECRVALWK